MEKTMNILRGMRSIFEMSPEGRYTRNDKTDAENLAGDWAAVGRDLRNAILRVRKEYKDVDFDELDRELRSDVADLLGEKNETVSAHFQSILKKLDIESDPGNGKRRD